MIDDCAYEAVSLRENGDLYTVEILGRQPEAAAILRAQRCADLWQRTVNLYRVPFVRAGSKPWSKEQLQLVRVLLPIYPAIHR
jgi:hypothetical protein